MFHLSAINIIRRDILSILAGLIICHGVFSQEKDKSGDVEKLNGNVLELTSETYSVKGGLFKSYSEGERIYEPKNENFVKEFDKKGLVVKRTSILSSGEKGSSAVYEYDDDNRYKTVVFYNSRNEITGRTFYSHGKQVDYASYLKKDSTVQSKTVWKKDSLGNKIEIYEYENSNVENSKSFAKFDDRGQMIQMNVYRVGNIPTKFSYKYDAVGNVIERSVSAVVGNQYYGKTVYKYNENRDLVQEEVYSEKNALREKTTYAFTYDSQNNWIQKVVIKDGKAQYMVIRKIKYQQ